MGNKSNAATAAEQGLEDLESLMSEPVETPSKPSAPGLAAAPAYVSSDTYGDDEEMDSLGMGARVDLFFIHKLKPGKKLGDNQKIITEGQEFFGRYEGSFTSGKYNSRTHKITLTKGDNNGTVIGLPACGKLDKDFQFVPQNAPVLVRFTGSNVIKTGKWKGSDAYTYETAVPKTLSARIKGKDPTLVANYELKKAND